MGPVPGEHTGGFQLIRTASQTSEARMVPNHRTEPARMAVTGQTSGSFDPAVLTVAATWMAQVSTLPV